MKTIRIAYGMLGLAIIVIISSAVIWRAHHQNDRDVQTSEQAPKPTAQQVQPDPMEIEAIRARSYKASAITVVREAVHVPNATVESYQSDGNTVQALLALPEGSRPKKGYPVIILCHGYENPAVYRTDTTEYYDWITSLTQAGFAVIKPDYRGNGESGGQPSSGHYSQVYAYDILNLIASIKQDDRFDAKRIGLTGQSMGGHVALRTVVASRDIKATVLASGVVGSMYDIFYHWPHSPAPSDQPGDIVQAQYRELVDKHGTPKSNPDFYNKVSAINYVKYVNGPVQIDASTGDSTVPYAFSQHLNATLRQSHKDVTFYTYAGDDHPLGHPENHKRFLQRATVFFKQYL